MSKYRFKPLAWIYRAGKRHRNRVTVFIREGQGAITMEWRENKVLHRRTLRHANRMKAQAAAIEKAGELMRASPTYEPMDVIIRMRQDLVRVARLHGLPDGYAPPLVVYAKHGEFHQTNVRAAFKGWFKNPDTNSGNPYDQWGRSMERFGFKMASTLKKPTYASCAADVRRVAALLGKPREMPSVRAFRQMGNWGQDTIRRYLRAKTWPEIAAALGLEMSEFRKAQVDQMRRALGHPHPTTAISGLTHREEQAA